MLKSAEVRVVRLPMVAPFRAPFGVVSDREVVLAILHSEGEETFVGESASLPAPVYSPDYTGSVVDVLATQFLPAVLRSDAQTALDVQGVLSVFHGHRMAHAAVVDAMLAVESAATGRSVAQLLGVSRSEVECGISLGIEPSVDALVRKVDDAIEQGFLRVKLKISPEWFLEPIRAVRVAHPRVQLSVDANSSFHAPEHLDALAQLDEYDLLMLEQPFAADDLISHRDLQARTDTPICLDESIETMGDLRTALEIDACRVVNLKVGRVGGLLNVKRLHDECFARDTPVWCGGLMESGIGQAACLIAAGLPGFTLPADIGPSSRYFTQDLATIGPLRNGRISVPSRVGQPLPFDQEALDQLTIRKIEVSV